MPSNIIWQWAVGLELTQPSSLCGSLTAYKLANIYVHAINNIDNNLINWYFKEGGKLISSHLVL
jgi:hypothetical protein